MFKAKGNLARIDNNAIIAVMHEGIFGVNHIVKIVFDEKLRNDVLNELQHKEGKLNGTLAGKSIMLHKIEITIY